jgi:hypothetical protein
MNATPAWRRLGYHPTATLAQKVVSAHVWPDRPAARAERQAASALGRDSDDDNWIESLADLSHDPSADPSQAQGPEPLVPPWPIRRVTARMKRCPLPDAEEIAVLFSDLLSDDRDTWAETDVDVTRAIQDALAGSTLLFLGFESDGLTPHYGRVTVTRGCARLVLWEGGGSVCDDTISATRATWCWRKLARELSACSRPTPRSPTLRPNWRSFSARRPTPGRRTLPDGARSTAPVRALPGTVRPAGPSGSRWRPRRGGCVRSPRTRLTPGWPP